MNSTTTHHVTIKGTKDGLVFLLNDNCSFEDIMLELETKLSLSEKSFFQGPINHVTIQTGSRVLTKEEEEQLRNRVSLHGNLIIQSIRHDEVQKTEKKPTSSEQLQILTKTVRSGQILQCDASIMLLGDVNPGGCVISKGDIYILGSLRGMAHAGNEGDRDTIIAASVMYPTQLRIADVISRPPEEWDDQSMELEFAFLEGEEMSIEKINQLHKIRPSKERILGSL